MSGDYCEHTNLPFLLREISEHYQREPNIWDINGFDIALIGSAGILRIANLSLNDMVRNCVGR